MPTNTTCFGLQRVGDIINPAKHAPGNTQQSGQGHVVQHVEADTCTPDTTRQKIIEPIIICDIFYTGCGAEDSFQNLHEFNAGFAQRLLLKDGAVPTLKAEAAVYWLQTVSTFYCLYMSFKRRVLLLFLVASRTYTKSNSFLLR